ncbi:hypothetical protein PO124_14380 [Bacillus licheniformis]|nr:hypothetical protein [Bacillus licheniformis]
MKRRHRIRFKDRRSRISSVRPNGYSATSVDEIMKEAGFLKLRLFVFKSKEMLFLHIMNEQMEDRFQTSMNCFRKRR